MRMAAVLIALGLASNPGGAATMQKHAPFGYRYQYLAGGVNTGNGWANWAPDGGFVRADNGQSAFTHGIELGVTRGEGNLQQQTEQLLQGFAQSNPQLRRQSNYSRTSIGGRQGLTTTLSSVSEVTGGSEAVNVSTVQLRDGSVLFMIGVAPTDQARTYMTTFNRIRQNVQLADNR